jgi:hypothetical protein
MKYIFQKNTEIPKKKDAMSGDLDFEARQLRASAAWFVVPAISWFGN